jgi:hypothetical protein
MIAAGFVPPPGTTRPRAPFVDCPHDAQGAYETCSTQLPQYAQCM